ncbi:MAG: hypothetical protein ABIQ70_05565 [Dokdonella sp.]
MPRSRLPAVSIKPWNSAGGALANARIAIVIGLVAIAIGVLKAFRHNPSAPASAFGTQCSPRWTA